MSGTPSKKRKRIVPSAAAQSPAGAATGAADTATVAAPVVAQPAPPAAPGAESPPWSNVIKGVVAGATIVLLAIIIWRFRALIQPLIFAAILAYLLNPIVNLAMRRFRIARGTAVLAVYLGFIVAALGLIAAIGIVAFTQADRLVGVLPNAFNQGYAWFLSNIASLQMTFGEYTIVPFAGVDDTSIVTALSQLLGNFNYLEGGTVAANLLGGTISVLSTLFVIMFVAIYLSRDTPYFGRALEDFAAIPGYQHDVGRLSREFIKIWDAYLRGQVLLALSMFVIVSTVLSILGVNYSLALGGLAGLLEFLPVVGPLVSMIAAAAVTLFQDSNWLGLSPIWYTVLVVVVMVVLQQIENAVLVPRFVGDALDLHPVVVIVVVLMGTSLAGILGAVLAAPVAASAKLLGGYGWRKMFDLPPFPDEERPGDPGQEGVIAYLAGQWRKRFNAEAAAGAESTPSAEPADAAPPVAPPAAPASLPPSFPPEPLP